MTAKKAGPVTVHLTPCKSSTIESLGYDPVTRTLAVKFKNGGVYHYHDVPLEAHRALRHPGASIGRVVSLVGARHKFTKIGEIK